jgi:plasmid stability protein
MKNITLAIDENILRQARIFAAKHDTTVNALVRDYLTELAGSEEKAFEERAAAARKRLGELSEQSEGRLGPNWKWNREDAYEGRLLPRHQRSDLRGFGKGPSGDKEGDSS